MNEHFVNFLSPGTFFNEERELSIESWDIEKACEMARSIKERHGATPYAFFFVTRGDNMNAKRSGMYYLGGIIETIEDVRKRNNDGKADTLLWNMENNKWDRVITNRNSYRVTQPFRIGDVVIDWENRDKTEASEKKERKEESAKEKVA